MSDEIQEEPASGDEVEARLSSFIPRGLVGGALMGLANLVPGISGGTMLLAAGVYPAFIDAIADVTTLRIRRQPVVVLAAIGGAALVSIVLLAGPTRTLVIEQRPLMYSFFIGLTLGGLPLVWRLAQPVTRSVWLGAASSFALMVAMSLGAESRGAAEPNFLLLLISGLAGASAMILPGISGGYLLLLLGQYEPILGAIDTLKRGLIGANGFDARLILDAADVVVPVGMGVVLGVVVVSNALRWLLRRFEKPTLGVLLGLLLGAVVGLYPFQEPVPPQPGFEIHGQPVAIEELEGVAVEDWPLERFAPTSGQAATSAAVVTLGLLITVAITRIGRSPRSDPG